MFLINTDNTIGKIIIINVFKPHYNFNYHYYYNDTLKSLKKLLFMSNV